MGKIFYISDLHFGHANILRFDNRPFETVTDMEIALITRWNKTVASDDTVYILGDFCWGKEQEWLRLLCQLNGRKVLIRGNHDLKEMSKTLRNQFQDVKDYKEISDAGRHVILSHYPILLYKGSYNPQTYMLCGHVHVTRENVFLEIWTDQLRQTRKANTDSCGNIINVGCMMPWMNYTPRTLDEIIEARDLSAGASGLITMGSPDR